MGSRRTPHPGLILLAALICGCSGGGPRAMEPAPTGRIQGQPILVVEVSPAPLAPWSLCGGLARWVLYDDGHILFCDTLLTHQRHGAYRVAQMRKETLKAFLNALPRERLRTEESMFTEEGGDLSMTTVALRDGKGWMAVRVHGRIMGRRSVMARATSWMEDKIGLVRLPPPAFGEILAEVRSIPLQASVPFEGKLPSLSAIPNG